MKGQRLTDETRAKVKRLIRQGMARNQIAAKVEISTTAVSAIAKEIGWTFPPNKYAAAPIDPTPEEIAAGCLEILDHEWTDERGVVHLPKRRKTTGDGDLREPRVIPVLHRRKILSRGQL